MTKVSVGADVDAYCTKCKLVLTHTVKALLGEKPKRVTCNTCDGEHNYRATKPKSKVGTKKGTTRTSSRKTKNWDDLVKEATGKPHKAYSMSGSFGEGDWIDHATFGLGCVQNFTAPNKILVRFSDSTKKLICNQSEA